MMSQIRRTAIRVAGFVGLLLPAGGLDAANDLRRSVLESDEVLLSAKLDRARRSDEPAIVKAAIEDGVLVVVGVTAKPKEKVILDGSFRMRSGADRIYTFEEAHFPEDCTVIVRTSGERMTALVQYCGLKGQRNREAREARQALSPPAAARAGLPTQAVRSVNDENRRFAGEIELFADEPLEVGCALGITTSGGAVRLDAHFGARIENAVASVTIVRSAGGGEYEPLVADGRPLPELWRGAGPFAYGQLRFIDESVPVGVPVTYALVLSRLEAQAEEAAIEFRNADSPCVLEATELAPSG